MKKIVSLAAAATLVLGVSVSVAPAANAACSGKLKIAYQGPLTGPEAALGINELNGVKFALKKFVAANPKVNVDINPYEDVLLTQVLQRYLFQFAFQQTSQ